MKKILKTVGLKESVFGFFLIGSIFKTAISLLPIDLTIFFMLLSMAMIIPPYLFKKKIYKIQLILISLYLGIVLIALGSLLYVPNIEYSMDKFFRFAILTGWSYIGAVLLFRDKESARRFIFFNIWFGVIMVAVFFVNWLQNGGQGARSIWGSNYLALGRSSAVSMILIISYLFVKKKVKWAFIISFPFTLCLALSGARMDFLTVFITLAVFGLFSLRLQLDRKWGVTFNKRVLLLIIVSCLSLSILIPNLQKSDKFVTLDRLSLLFQDDKGTSINGRIDRMEYAVEMIEDSKLMGEGIGSFYTYKFQKDYPHNIVLELLSELGIFSLILFILIVYFAWKKIKGNQQNEVILPMILVMIFLLVSSMTSGDLNDKRLFFSVLGLLGTVNIKNDA